MIEHRCQRAGRAAPGGQDAQWNLRSKTVQSREIIEARRLSYAGKIEQIA
jgi:hypothetical protein